VAIAAIIKPSGLASLWNWLMPRAERPSSMLMMMMVGWPNEVRLRALVRRRQELIAMRGAEKNRAKAPSGLDLAASFKAVIKAVDHQIQAIEAAMRDLIANSTLLDSALPSAPPWTALARSWRPSCWPSCPNSAP
jgi:hypothetical protein